MSLFSIFAGALLPILAIGAVGFLLGRVRDVDPEPLNTVTVYVLAPVLVFYSLATTELAGETLAALTAGVVAYHVAMLLVAGGVARLAGISDPLLGALVLVAAFPNSGNYGIPVSSFAFGVALVAGFGDPTVARTFVLESAMPAAVTPLILVAEFGDASGAGSATSLAEFVSAAVFATTLLSVPALSVLIYLLNHGFVV